MKLVSRRAPPKRRLSLPITGSLSIWSALFSLRTTRSLSRSHGFHGWFFSHSFGLPFAFSCAASSAFTSTSDFGFGCDSFSASGTAAVANVWRTPMAFRELASAAASARLIGTARSAPLSCSADDCDRCCSARVAASFCCGVVVHSWSTCALVCVCRMNVRACLPSKPVRSVGRDVIHSSRSFSPSASASSPGSPAVGAVGACTSRCHHLAGSLLTAASSSSSVGRRGPASPRRASTASAEPGLASVLYARCRRTKASGSPPLSGCIVSTFRLYTARISASGASSSTSSTACGDISTLGGPAGPMLAPPTPCVGSAAPYMRLRAAASPLAASGITSTPPPPSPLSAAAPSSLPSPPPSLAAVPPAGGAGPARRARSKTGAK
mmetsp:Transcript_50279/g.116063  ORF Transcript_50279/g.116063 Transcript_50279/m.116063 type:complete len:381 (+) Transcript_50279:284-1426(+)